MRVWEVGRESSDLFYVALAFLLEMSVMVDRLMFKPDSVASFGVDRLYTTLYVVCVGHAKWSSLGYNKGSHLLALQIKASIHFTRAAGPLFRTQML